MPVGVPDVPVKVAVLLITDPIRVDVITVLVVSKRRVVSVVALGPAPGFPVASVQALPKSVTPERVVQILGDVPAGTVCEPVTWVHIVPSYRQNPKLAGFKPRNSAVE